MDDETVLQAVTVFGARMRGESDAADTPELAAELHRRWTAEGHEGPGSVPGAAPATGLVRAGRMLRRGAVHLARRLPEPARARVRRVVETAGRLRARTGR